MKFTAAFQMQLSAKSWLQLNYCLDWHALCPPESERWMRHECGDVGISSLHGGITYFNLYTNGQNECNGWTSQPLSQPAAAPTAAWTQWLVTQMAVVVFLSFHRIECRCDPFQSIPLRCAAMRWRWVRNALNRKCDLNKLYKLWPWLKQWLCLWLSMSRPRSWKHWCGSQSTHSGWTRAKLIVL